MKMIYLVKLFFLFYSFHRITGENDITSSIDPKGYVAYCPCMGRFGNQADHFLGALAFAKGVDRTLILPPWVEYRYGEPKSIQVPFSTYFDVQSLTEYHRVITMDNFMEKISSTVWPENERISFCYVHRSSIDKKDETKTCNAKEGNPFGPFWDTFGIDFVKSEFYGPLHYDVHHGNMTKQWQERYPADKFPVLAFTGAPATFPVQDENRILHKYLKWNENFKSQALNYIKSTFKKGGFIGIHLRNGLDWVKACQHINQTPNLFAAPQCVGYRNQFGPATAEMCMPSKMQIIRQIKRLLKNMKDVKYIFVASDNNHMIDDLTEALKRQEITIHKLNESNPHLDLAILGNSNHFIGNCISSFTAFAKRERDARGLPSTFWAFPTALKSHSIKSHDEL